MSFLVASHRLVRVGLVVLRTVIAGPGMVDARMSLRGCGRFQGRRYCWGGGRDGQAARGPQTVILAGAVRVVVPRPAAGNACRVLVLWSRCRSRSMVTRRLPRSCRTASRVAAVSGLGRLAVPLRALVMAARRAAVKEICRGCTACPARRPLRAGAADRAAVRAAARTSSQAVIQAACSCRIMSGQCDRKIGPVEGPAPRMADLASRSAVSDPSHRHLYAAASTPAG